MNTQSVSHNWLAQAKLTNPAIGNIGSNPDAAVSGSLFLSYAVRMWRIAITIGALVVLGYYVWAGLEWILSGGDSKGKEKAKDRFIQATVGLILLVSSFAIVAFISRLFFGSEFDLLNITIPTT